MKVPDILLSGNHEQIKAWRSQKMLERTAERRNTGKSIKFRDNWPIKDVFYENFSDDFNNYPDW